MTKIYSFILALLIGVCALAADRPRSGMLTISMKDNNNSDMRVIVDGRNYTDRDNFFTISNIEPGYHSVQVYRMNSSRSPFDIFNGRNREQLIYSSSLYVKPSTEVEVTINKNGKSKVKERDIRSNGRNDNDDRWGKDDDKWDRNDRNNGGYGNNNGGYGNNNGGYGNNGGYNRTPSIQEMLLMKQTLRNERFENTRVSLARQMFNEHAFSAVQVKELLQEFSFENNKLDLAKYAYRNTIDRNNYYVVFDVFSYSSSKQELSNYMSSYR
jgi:hypothetical protein